MDEITPIIKKYLAGKASKEERLQLLEFLRGGEANLLLFQKAKEEWEADAEKSFTLTEWEAWSNVLKRIAAPAKSMIISKFWLNSYRVASIIAIVLLVAFSYGLTQLNNQKVIVSTKPGQNLNLVLPDESEVILNSNSTIEYRPLAFAFSRKVELKGEAFFDVKKSAFKPFRVQSDDLRIKVMGTRFNVNAYPNAYNYEVVLEEGSVHVSMASFHHQKSALSPSERLLMERNTGKAKISKVNTRLYTSWTQGVLYFYDTPFSDVVIRLQRRYGVQMEMSEQLVGNFLFSATIRNEPLAEVLGLIEAVLPVNVLEKEGIVRFSLDQKRYKAYERGKWE